MKSMRTRTAFRRRRGVAQAIAVFLLTIVLVAAIYIPLNFAVQEYGVIQQQQWPTNVYDPDSLSFVVSYWTWLPPLIFFVGIAYVYLKAQIRGPEG